MYILEELIIILGKFIKILYMIMSSELVFPSVLILNISIRTLYSLILTASDPGFILVREACRSLLHASFWMTLLSGGGAQAECPQADNGCQWGQYGGHRVGAAGSTGLCQWQLL